MKLRVLELFGGIGACSKALERLGINYEIADYVEIDKYAVKSFNALHNTNFEPQDICGWDKDMEVDLIMHGSPCQDFSLAGKQAGGDIGSGTRSSLMYETIRIVAKLKPKYVIWENVKNLLSKKHRHNFDAYLETMEKLGYTNYYQVLNAKDYGIPQNRERVFTVSILGNDDYTFPNDKIHSNLQDFLEPNTNISTKPSCRKAFEEEFDKIITSDKEIYQCDVSSGFQDCKVGIKVSPTIRAGNNCTHVLQNFEFPIGKECDNTIKIVGNYSPSGHDASRVVDENGLAPTVKENHGTVTAVLQRFEFPDKQDLTIKLKDILETDVDEKYYLTDKQIERIHTTTYNVGKTRIQKKDWCDTLCARDYKDPKCVGVTETTCDKYKEYTNFYTIPRGSDGELINGSYNRVWKDDKHVGTINVTKVQEIGNVKNEVLRIRKLTPCECWLLMGFDKTDFEKAAEVNSNSQLYKQAGNSIVVNVLEAILTNLLLPKQDKMDIELKKTN